MKTRTNWSPVRWPYSDASEYNQDVYPCQARKLGRGKIVLHPGMWPTEGWSYVASFGANSERSHSGFLKGFVALNAAQAEIERLIVAGKFA